MSLQQQTTKKKKLVIGYRLSSQVGTCIFSLAVYNNGHIVYRHIVESCIYDQCNIVLNKYTKH